MRASFRIGMPAVAALLVNGALLAALLTLGVGQRAPRKERATLTVMELAVLQGTEDGADEAEAADPPAAASTVTPAPHVPAPVVVPPVLVPAAMPAPAAPPSAPVPSTAPVASPADRATAPATPAANTSAAPATAPARRGARDGLDANAPAGTSRSYAAKVRSWLLAHKTYPKHARMRREEGVVRVFFVIDRAGRLIEGRVLAACGRAALDDEAVAMLRRASPYPPAPSDLPGERFEITAPVDFVLPG
ncbi:energy transducer TonB [Sphingomonas faeni]|uniref:energy transducer TonB n=1 Tax=Sphingomonas faeni TaxID=185950 RepID=UPI00336152DA